MKKFMVLIIALLGLHIGCTAAVANVCQLPIKGKITVQKERIVLLKAMLPVLEGELQRLMDVLKKQHAAGFLHVMPTTSVQDGVVYSDIQTTPKVLELLSQFEYVITAISVQDGVVYSDIQTTPEVLELLSQFEYVVTAISAVRCELLFAEHVLMGLKEVMKTSFFS